jgi:hypothetical protein
MAEESYVTILLGKNIVVNPVEYQITVASLNYTLKNIMPMIAAQHNVENNATIIPTDDGIVPPISINDLETSASEHKIDANAVNIVDILLEEDKDAQVVFDGKLYQYDDLTDVAMLNIDTARMLTNQQNKRYVGDPCGTCYNIVRLPS